MMRYLLIFLFLGMVLLTEQECKGPDGDSKPTPFRKNNNSIIIYQYDLDTEGIIYSVILFSSITAPALYFINKKRR